MKHASNAGAELGPRMSIVPVICTFRIYGEAGHNACAVQRLVEVTSRRHDDTCVRAPRAGKSARKHERERSNELGLSGMGRKLAGGYSDSR
jgi:hypothetical protein